MEREAASSRVSWRLLSSLGGVGLFLLLTMPGGRAQSEPKLLEALKTNAVRIEATWPTGNAQYGFGFIVGERASTQLYIATANHVVRDSDRGKSISVKVWLRGEGAATTAELLDNSSSVLDLAVLRVTKPQGFSWKADGLGSVEPGKERGLAVWFIGRDRDWFTPVIPGRIATVTFESKLQLEGLPVRVGSSGAPLVADSGIIGMLTSDEGDTSYGIPIEKVQQAFNQWSFPFTLTPPTAGSTSAAPSQAPPSRLPNSGGGIGARVGGRGGPGSNDRVVEFPSVPVQADRGWQPTGVQVARGDILRIAYVSGRWRNFERGEYVNPFDAPPPRAGRIGGGPRCDILGPVASAGLVGKIGDDGQPFNAAMRDLSGEGMLYLRINECEQGLLGNDGTVIVRVQLAHP
jgi:hypothetical protein